MTHEQIDMINRCIEVTDTVEEALEKALQFFTRGDSDSAFFMVNESLEGFMSVSSALDTLEKEGMESNELQNLRYDMEDSFGVLAEAFENDDVFMADNILRSQIFPSFKDWKAEMEKCYKKSTLN